MNRIAQRTFREGRLSEQVCAAVEKMIADEYPQPGQRLPKESDLAERFGVSRIVIREAMKILEDRGLVEVRAGRGTWTLHPSPDKVKQSLLRLFRGQPIPSADEMERLLEIRGILEEAAAALAAVRATDADFQAIDGALARIANGASAEDTVAADLAFHTAIAHATQNRYFEIVLQPLTEVFAQQVTLTDSVSTGVELHQSVRDAIRKRDPVAARQAVRKLIKATVESMRKGLAILTAQ